MMRKFTLFFLTLFAMVGGANAQTSTDYSDPTTAPGVVPALSTTDGTVFAYYLRNVQYSGSFASKSTFADGVLCCLTGTDAAIKVAVVANGSGFNIARLNDETISASGYICCNDGAPLTWTTGNNTNIWTFTDVSATDAETGDVTTKYYMKSASKNKALGAHGENLQVNSNNRANTSLFYTSGLDQTAQNQQWQFIPANDAAKAAAQLTIKVASGEDVHGNLTTFSASYPTAVPAGYEAFTAAVSGSDMTLTALEGSVIPASTGVILRGATNTALSITPSLTTATATSALTPTNESTKTVATGETIYGLGMPSTTLGFFKVKENTTIGAHKAYYTATTDGGSAIRMDFSGTTGISAVTTADDNAPVYDLSGRIVKQTVSGGLYIKNGKKFIVK